MHNSHSVNVESRVTRVTRVTTDLMGILKSRRKRTVVLMGSFHSDQQATPEEPPLNCPQLISLIVGIELMRQYPHLAPCAHVRGHWIYRGQGCGECADRPGCASWPDGETFSKELPVGLSPLAKNGVRQ